MKRPVAPKPAPLPSVGLPAAPSLKRLALPRLGEAKGTSPQSATAHLAAMLSAPARRAAVANRTPSVKMPKAPKGPKLS